MTGGIVVVGGGFAGFWAAVAARRVVENRAPVTLLSRGPKLVIRPRLYEANPADFSVDLRPMLASVDVRLVQGEAVELSADQVKLAHGEYIPFSRAVVATGSVMRRPSLPGAEAAWSIDTQLDAIAFDGRLSELALSRRNAHVIVVGAGLAGIELALELRDRFATHGGNGEEMRITLIDRAPSVGQSLGDAARAHIVSALADARVELRLASEVTSLGSDRVQTADGSLAADAVVLCTGLVAAAFAKQVIGERDALGRLLVAEDLRAPRMPTVFVAGDAASAHTGGGHTALQSCQHALQIGRYAGENAARDWLGRPTLPYRQPSYVTCIDLGRAGALYTEGWERRVVETGPAAKRIKQHINRRIIYPPTDADRATLLALSNVLPSQG